VHACSGSRPSISCRSWLSTRAPTPPPAAAPSRDEASASISSKKMMAGEAARAWATKQ